MTEGTNTPTHECFPAQTRGENVLNVPLVQLLQPPSAALGTYTRELRAAGRRWCCCQADTCPRDSMPGELNPCRADRSALVKE